MPPSHALRRASHKDPRSYPLPFKPPQWVFSLLPFPLHGGKPDRFRCVRPAAIGVDRKCSTTLKSGASGPPHNSDKPFLVCLPEIVPHIVWSNVDPLRKLKHRKPLALQLAHHQYPGGGLKPFQHVYSYPRRAMPQARAILPVACSLPGLYGTAELYAHHRTPRVHSRRGSR